MAPRRRRLLCILLGTAVAASTAAIDYIGPAAGRRAAAAAAAAAAARAPPTAHVFAAHTTCRSCVRAGFGWKVSAGKCGRFKNKACSACWCVPSLN